MAVVLLSPGDPGQRTGGYLYNARVVACWRARGHDVRVAPIDGEWPLPGGAGGLPRVGPDDHVVADGLLWTGLGAARQTFHPRQVTVWVHLALHCAVDLPSDEVDRRRALEAEALAPVRHVVATGAPTVRALAHLARPIHLVAPGVKAAPPVPAAGRQLLTVGTITPRKGLLDLVDALDRLQGPWTWALAGSADRDPVYAARLRAAIEARGWTDRVSFLGELDEAGLERAYADAALLLHGATHEPWGMVLQEALARGLPVVSRDAGALEASPPGAYLRWRTPGEAAAALVQVLDDPAPLRRAARAAHYPSWEQVADRLWAITTSA